ncbi:MULTISPECIES: hypothetical protein [unclassified Streptomyces]|uniref:hypothetical protein n=1 Tax=unclassified Streptomyces TaxID=2593676 RepID=UPI0037F6F78A
MTPVSPTPPATSRTGGRDDRDGRADRDEYAERGERGRQGTADGFTATEQHRSTDQHRSTERRGTEHRPTERRDTAREETGTGTSTLIPHDETDQLTSRMRHAVAGFVDRPRDAVEEADQVLEELAARFTEAVNARRRTLRGSWHADGATAGDNGRTDRGNGRTDGADTATPASADTEQLRLALRDYRALTERLLHV